MQLYDGFRIGGIFKRDGIEIKVKQYKLNRKEVQSHIKNHKILCS